MLEAIVAGDGVKEPPLAAPMWFRTEVTKAMFEAESDEVKDEIERYRNEEDGRDDNEDEDADDISSNCDDEDAQRKAKAWAYHRSVLSFN